MNTSLTTDRSHAGTTPDEDSLFLVIGYGSSAHGNHAVARQVTNLVQQLELPNVRVIAVEKLTPELSSRLAEADYAIFVDVCQMEETDVKVSPLEACGLETAGSSVPGWGHSWHPCSLLALTHSSYCRHPQSWWVEVKVQDSVTGHYVSHQANRSMHHAVEEIEALIRQNMNNSPL
jgi:Ni,Fe-hydrogenase maturation factor